MTIDALKAEFTSDAWADLHDDESTLYRFLNSDTFKNVIKRLRDEQIDSETLALFAILHCPGRAQDKAEHLWFVIHEGKIDQPFIAAADKN